jgi:hypothetical protein
MQFQTQRLDKLLWQVQEVGNETYILQPEHDLGQMDKEQIQANRKG